MTSKNIAKASPFQFALPDPEAEKQLTLTTNEIASRWETIEPTQGGAMLATNAVVLRKLRNQLIFKRNTLENAIRELENSATLDQKITLITLADEVRNDINSVDTCLENMNRLFSL